MKWVMKFGGGLLVSSVWKRCMHKNTGPNLLPTPGFKGIFLGTQLHVSFKPPLKASCPSERL